MLACISSSSLDRVVFLKDKIVCGDVTLNSLHNMMLKNKDSGLMDSQSGLGCFPIVTVNEEGVSEHFEKQDLVKRVCSNGFFNPFIEDTP